MTGFEPFIGAATAGLAGLITNLVREKGNETLQSLDLDIGRNLAFRNALANYVKRYIERHGTLKVLCARMDNAVKLDEIYTVVQLLERRQLSYYESLEKLQELFLKSGKRNLSLTSASKKIGMHVANKQPYLMVLGGPGVGKSTFLKKIGLEAIKSIGKKDFSRKTKINASTPHKLSYEHSCIPVMLELRQFDDPNLDIRTKIANELDICGFPQAQELTRLLLKSGKLLILLDGLDEVPSNSFEHTIIEIENLVDRYSNNRFIALVESLHITLVVLNASKMLQWQLLTRVKLRPLLIIGFDNLETMKLKLLNGAGNYLTIKII